MFYKRQQDAVEAARSKGVKEVEVSFSIPGARFVTKVKVKDLESSLPPRAKKVRAKAMSEIVGPIPTEKLLQAIDEAKDVTIFYKTPEELFDALDKQD